MPFFLSNPRARLRRHMPTVRNSPSLRQSVVAAILCMSGCAPLPSSIPLHDTPLTGVWITVDRSTETAHSHPYVFQAADMEKILSGVQVEERDTITGTGLLGSKYAKPAFTKAEIARVSQYLVEGLKKASPKDLATFYMVVNDGQHKRSVTSGGIFVDEKRRVHVILANWRSAPSGGQDYTIAMELDTRDEPLLPISPFRFRVGFLPAEAWLKNRSDRGERSFPAYRSAYGDPAKSLVIDLDLLLHSHTPEPTREPKIQRDAEGEIKRKSDAQ
jgi:hypothetical protein